MLKFSLAITLASVALSAAGFPNPTVDLPRTASTTEKAVLAGGCFWGVEAIFDSLKGVTDAVSGYAGGTAGTAQYEVVSSGTTGHAESVEITYDPSKVSYGQILKVYFSVAHDPTQLNRQGPDTGTQYRSAIFYANQDQKRIAEAYIAQLDAAKVYPHKIVTKLEPLKGFYAAEAYHQDYVAHNPYQPYVMFNDAPKLKHFQEQFPEMVKGKTK